MTSSWAFVTLCPPCVGYRAQVETLLKEKAAALLECQNLHVAATIALQKKEDAEVMCTEFASTVQNLQVEVSQNERSMVASAQQIKSLEVTVATLTKSGEEQAAHLRGASLLAFHQLFAHPHFEHHHDEVISFAEQTWAPSWRLRRLRAVRRPPTVRY